MATTADVQLNKLRRLQLLLTRPTAIFVLLSALFGTIIILLTPPLRGPDEAAHFLRAYAIAHGDIIPSNVDAEGRKGTFLSPRVHRDFAVFTVAHARERLSSPSSEAIVNNGHSTGDSASPIFVLYEGSEGYSPVTYLPQVAGAFVARLAGLDFVPTLFIMRFAGLAAMTGVVAYAIAIVPQIKWAFLFIAMLPAALYGRAVISADSGANAYAMMVIALWLRSVAPYQEERGSERALWTTLCVLSKPPNLAFILLETMGRPLQNLRNCRSLALIILPGLIAALAWTGATSGDGGTWRQIMLTGRPPEQFDPAWKLAYILKHPLHFPAAVMATFKDVGELWRQLIGVLGLFDIVLRLWVYPVLTFLLVVPWLTPVGFASAMRRRVAIVVSVTAIAYGLAVFAIFFLIWTPVDANEVWGVQGRYFIPALPLIAIATACLVNRGPGENVTAVAATVGVIISGAATIEAILRVDWKL